MENLFRPEDYGKIISTLEYIVDRKIGRVCSYSFSKDDVVSKLSKGTIHLEGNYIKDEVSSGYDNNIIHTSKDKGTEFNINYFSTRPYKLYHILEIEDTKLNGDVSSVSGILQNVITYEESNNKMEDNFTIDFKFYNNISDVDLDIDIIVPKNCKAVLYQNAVHIIDEETNILRELYIVLNNIISHYEIRYNDKKFTNNTLSLIDFSTPQNMSTIELSNFESFTNILSGIPEIYTVPKVMKKDGTIYDLIYTDSGILTNVYDGKDPVDYNILFEEVYNMEDEYDFTIASLHPFIYSEFDSGLFNTGRLFCLDELISEDDRFFRFVRRVYDINEDKYDDFINKIHEDYNEPVLEIISL